MKWGGLPYGGAQAKVWLNSGWRPRFIYRTISKFSCSRERAAYLRVYTASCSSALQKSRPTNTWHFLWVAFNGDRFTTRAKAKVRRRARRAAQIPRP